MQSVNTGQLNPTEPLCVENVPSINHLLFADVSLKTDE
jgi:hypothetical protein